MGVHIFLYGFWLVTINRFFVNETMISLQIDVRVMNREYMERDQLWATDDAKAYFHNISQKYNSGNNDWLHR